MSVFNSHIFNTWLKNCRTDMCGCMYIPNCSKRWSTNFKCIMHKKENEWETNSSCGFRQKLYCYQSRTTKTVTFSTKHRMFERQVNHKMINIQQNIVNLYVANYSAEHKLQYTKTYHNKPNSSTNGTQWWCARNIISLHTSHAHIVLTQLT